MQYYTRLLEILMSRQFFPSEICFILYFEALKLANTFGKGQDYKDFRLCWPKDKIKGIV